MRRALGAFVIAVLVLVSTDVITNPASAANKRVPEIFSAKISANSEKTRFVAKLNFAVGYNVYVLENPYRLVVDIPEVIFNLPPSAGDVEKGFITGFRFGQLDERRSRIVMDLTGPVLIQNSYAVRAKGDRPARLIIDLIGTDEVTFARIHKNDAVTDLVARENAKDGMADDGLIPEETPPISAQGKAYDPIADMLTNKKKKRKNVKKRRSNKILVVIDPGHGGIDSGTVSKSGIEEKKIVLAFSRTLKKHLEAYGRYRVLLTRDNDRFIKLAKRRDVAHKNQAALFIAVHADAIRHRRVRGTTLYTLSDKASDHEAAELARKENQADIIGGVNLKGETKEITNILIDLAQRETKNHSVFVARKIVKGLSKVTRMNKHPLRSAGFVVLKAPDVPSILLELGYLSNATDAKLLSSEVWRNKVARALARSINGYFRAKLALN